nr:uncharacterized protein LOC105348889 isoform X1 [Crassostrea gigas]XP_034307151.1 uncharacterized protein LOC105348889 isoform X1 [Crassostrea gigas]
MKTTSLPFVDIFLFFHFAASSPTIYSFGKTCSMQPHQINEVSVFYVSFFNTGKPMDMWCSNIAFSGYGSNSKDKYQICTTLERFSDPTCNLRLTLRNSLNGTVFKTFTCRQKSMSKFCATQSESLYFVAEFYTKERWTQSEFLFQVETTKSYDHVKTVSGICGGVFGVILIITIAVYLKCRKLKSNTCLRRRFRDIPVQFFCRNSSYDQESSISSATGYIGNHVNSMIEPLSDEFRSSFMDPGPYVIIIDSSSHNSIISGESNIPMPPPPYSEQGQVFQDPPPEYSSVMD